MSSAARSDLKMNTFRNASRSINSKIEGAKIIRTLLGSSIDEIDTQIWLAERLGLVDVNKLNVGYRMFFHDRIRGEAECEVMKKKTF